MYYLFTLLFLMTFITPSHAEIKGKIDAGPAWVHIDVLESNKTVKKIDMAAIKADSTILIWKGVCLKPNILYGKNGVSETASGGIGIGHYTPFCEKFSITPSIGCSFTQFKTHFNYRLPFGSVTLKERFHSVSPYACMEASYCFASGWRLCGIYQYVFSKTNTKITSAIGFNSTTRSHPKGPNYALILEKDLNANWSVNIAGAYNISLTKEKHGLRAYGARIALAYWFP